MKIKSIVPQLRILFVTFVFIFMTVMSVYAQETHKDDFNQFYAASESETKNPITLYQHLVCNPETNGTVPTILRKFQVVYVYDKVNNFVTEQPIINNLLVSSDVILDRNAKLYNKSLHFNFVIDENCKPKIDVLQAEYGDILHQLTIHYGEAYVDTHKLLVFVESMKGSDGDCGVFSGIMNSNEGLDLLGGFALIYKACFSERIIIHELMHSLSAVQFNVPETDYTYHLKRSKHDVMSYNVGTENCPVVDSFLYTYWAILDCRQHNYLNFKNEPTNFFNIYNSTYLNHNNIFYLFFPTVINVSL